MGVSLRVFSGVLDIRVIDLKSLFLQGLISEDHIAKLFYGFFSSDRMISLHLKIEKPTKKNVPL